MTGPVVHTYRAAETGLCVNSSLVEAYWPASWPAPRRCTPGTGIRPGRDGAQVLGGGPHRVELRAAPVLGGIEIDHGDGRRHRLSPRV